MEKKEKPLDKMTAKELREMALGLPGIHGVHAMKKEELIVAIRAAKGITEPEVKKEKRVVCQKRENHLHRRSIETESKGNESEKRRISTAEKFEDG